MYKNYNKNITTKMKLKFQEMRNETSHTITVVEASKYKLNLCLNSEDEWGIEVDEIWIPTKTSVNMAWVIKEFNISLSQLKKLNNILPEVSNAYKIKWKLFREITRVVNGDVPLEWLKESLEYFESVTFTECKASIRDVADLAEKDALVAILTYLNHLSETGINPYEKVKEVSSVQKL